MNKPSIHKKINKGFTLVELIVVLAVLAILATMLVPALTGYIDKANDKKLIAKARSLYTASQSVVSEQYAINSAFEKSTDYFEDSGMNAEIIDLSEVDGEYECYIALDSVYRVSELFYKENDKSVYLKDGSFEVMKDTEKPSTANIAIKTTQIQVPGSKYIDILNELGDKATSTDRTLLLSIEQSQRDAIKYYQEHNLQGKYAFVIKFNKETGIPYIYDVPKTKVSLSNNDLSSKAVVEDGGSYLIVIDGNTITTNIVIREEYGSGFNKVRSVKAELNVQGNIVAGFNPFEKYG